MAAFVEDSNGYLINNEYNELDYYEDENEKNKIYLKYLNKIIDENNHLLTYVDNIKNNDIFIYKIIRYNPEKDEEKDSYKKIEKIKKQLKYLDLIFKNNLYSKFNNEKNIYIILDVLDAYYNKELNKLEQKYFSQTDRGSNQINIDYDAIYNPYGDNNDDKDKAFKCLELSINYEIKLNTEKELSKKLDDLYNESKNDLVERHNVRRRITENNYLIKKYSDIKDHFNNLSIELNKKIRSNNKGGKKQTKNKKSKKSKKTKKQRKTRKH